MFNMKKSLFNASFTTLTLLLLTLSSFAQNMPRATDTDRNLLRKSRAQKVTAVTLATIGGIFIVGNAFWNSEVEHSSNIIVFEKTFAGYLIGGAMVAGSIPLFNGSKQNKAKAQALTARLKKEPLPIVLSGKSIRSYGAVAIQWHF
jgi:hypothetical protein